jgi:uncharacterized protein YdhG (YjbR/CyaY superfamily)
MDKTKPRNTDEYIAGQPKDIQVLLDQLRAAIKKAAPEAEEVIAYQMPAFRQNGILVYFAAFKDHIGFFPAPSGIEAFETEIASYKSGKGTLRFPLDKPLPLDLVTRIVKFRVEENLNKIRKKTQKS